MAAVLLLSATVSHAESPDNYVKAAHEKFLSTDFKNTDQVREAVVAIKEGLEKAQSAVPENFAARDNLLKLYDQFLQKAQNERFPKEIMAEAKGKTNLGSIAVKLKEYAKTHGEVVPTGWSLPEDFKFLVFSQERKLKVPKNQVEYVLSFFGWMQEGKAVPESIQLIRYPNEVLIDKEKSIGSWWGEGTMEGETTKTFHSDTAITNAPSKEGLYLINIKMPNQKEFTKGWVIVSQMAATDAPLVQSPQPGQVFKTPNPTLRWANYKSTKLRSFESRKRLLSVGLIEDDWKKVWGKSEVMPGNETSFKLGKENSLIDGTYTFIHSMQERWFLGDMLMQRQSATSSRFLVKTK